MRIKHGLAIVLLIGLYLVSGGGMAQNGRDSLVLVCGDAVDIESLSRADARKLFLGVPTIRNDARLRPILNASDPRMTEVFLQNIIFMSKREYERQLVLRVFRQGGQMPPEYDNVEALEKALLDTPGSVSFMWSGQLERYKGLKSLGVLWSGSSD